MHLTSQNIPELAGLNFQQRMQVIKHAIALLPVTRKIILNVLKIIILVHFFSILARFEGWLLAPYLLLAGLVYPLVINPVTFALTRSHMAAARKEIQL
jgi:hypothetical protein